MVVNYIHKLVSKYCYMYMQQNPASCNVDNIMHVRDLAAVTKAPAIRSTDGSMKQNISNLLSTKVLRTVKAKELVLCSQQPYQFASANYMLMNIISHLRAPYLPQTEKVKR